MISSNHETLMQVVRRHAWNDSDLRAGISRGSRFMSSANCGSSAQDSGLSLVEDRSRGRRYETLKSWLDSAAAAAILIAAVPVMAVAMILVRLSRRGLPSTARGGWGVSGRTFTIYKIRTMIRDSEPCGPRWCVPGDPRVTPVGGLLRWSHVDELPQLINVLRGEMSLIGPRPERPEIVAQLERLFPDYRLRLWLRPGLTGLAQVLLPPDTEIGSVGVKLKYDLHYVTALGPWLDLKIALATFFHLVNAPRGWIARRLPLPLPRRGIEGRFPHLRASQSLRASQPGTVDVASLRLASTTAGVGAQGLLSYGRARRPRRHVTEICAPIGSN